MTHRLRLLAASSLALFALSCASAQHAGAPGPGTGAAPQTGSRGERALRASFYLNTVTMQVEMVNGVKSDVLGGLELDPQRRAIVDKAIEETWTEERIYAHAAAALEKELPADVLDAALAQMTPEVQATIRAGIVTPTEEEVKAWLETARKHPDAKERAGLARRLVVHMPQPDAFMELIQQVPEALSDAAQQATGSDDFRAPFSKGLMDEMKPLFDFMGNREALVVGTVAAYRDTPTGSIRAMVDALDSDSGKQLQQAALASLLAGLKQTRADLVARLQRELGAAQAP